MKTKTAKNEDLLVKLRKRKMDSGKTALFLDYVLDGKFRGFGPLATAKSVR